MLASIKSPTAKPAGLLMVIVLLCVVNEVVENPRSAICATSALPLSTRPSNNKAFDINDERNTEGRNVPMSIKN